MCKLYYYGRSLMPYAQLLLRHGPLKLETDLDSDTLNDLFHQNLDELNQHPTPLTASITQWARSRFPKKDTMEYQTLLSKTNEPVAQEKVKFQQRIAYEIVQFLKGGFEDEKAHQAKLKNIYYAYYLYSSYEITEGIGLSSIISNVLEMFDLTTDALDAQYPPQNALLATFGHIADKLVKQRIDRQGVSDIQYALHFLSFILIIRADKTKLLDQWKGDTPKSFSNKYFECVQKINAQNARKTGMHITTLIQIYSIVKGLLIEHPKINSEGAHADAIAYGKRYLPGARITSVQDFFNEIEMRVPAINNNSAPFEILSSSSRSNNNANNGGALPPEAIHLAQNLSTQAVGNVVDDAGGCTPM